MLLFWVDKFIPHYQCIYICPNGNQCYAETDYCTGVLLENDESCWLDSVCKSEYCLLAAAETCAEHDNCKDR